MRAGARWELAREHLAPVFARLPSPQSRLWPVIAQRIFVLLPKPAFCHLILRNAAPTWMDRAKPG